MASEFVLRKGGGSALRAGERLRAPVAAGDVERTATGLAAGTGSAVAVGVSLRTATGSAVAVGAAGPAVLRTAAGAAVGTGAAGSALVVTAAGSATGTGTAAHVALQFARPQTVLSAGGWTRHDGATTGLAEAIDEVTANDADYIKSSESPVSADVFRVRLSPIEDPGTGIVRWPRYRFAKDAAAGDTLNFRVRLYESDGTTLLDERVHLNVSDGWQNSPVNDTEITGVDAASYGDGLILEFEAVKA